MNFKPATEEEIKANKVWPNGVYPFLIVEAEEKLSARKGNPMIELRIVISKSDGSKRTIRDYLLPQREEKLMHAARACAVFEKYQSGSLEAGDFVGKSGSLKLGIERSKIYPPKNVVLDYVC
jgi:hypothetical protein